MNDNLIEDLSYITDISVLFGICKDCDFSEGAGYAARQVLRGRGIAIETIIDFIEDKTNKELNK